MTDNDYSIKPLQNLPNVTGLNIIKDSKGRNKRQSSHERPQEISEPAEDEQKKTKEQEFDNIVKDINDNSVDYCA